MEQPAQRVLIYRLGSLGDTVVALPALHLIARAFPLAERRLLTNFPVNSKAPAAADIIGPTNLIHSCLRYPASTRNPFVLLKLWWTILRTRPQVLIYLAAARGIPVARRDARFFRLCGIRTQIGVPLTEDMQVTRPLPGLNLYEPESTRLARNLAPLGDAHIEDPAAWDLHLTPAEHQRAAQALTSIASRPILAVGLGTKIQPNDWGLENWQSLLRLLASSYSQYALAFFGATEDFEASQQAAAAWEKSANPDALTLNLCGRLTPRETAAALARCRLFLGHDSGPMHLAAAVQTPCVAIFSSRNLPGRWFPHGRHHHPIYHTVSCMGCRLTTCIAERKRCILSITPTEVAIQVHAALNSVPHS